MEGGDEGVRQEALDPHQHLRYPCNPPNVVPSLNWEGVMSIINLQWN